MSDNERALEWLQKQLRKKCIALERAERKPNKSGTEIADIKAAIEVLEYLTEVVGKDER